MPVTLLKGVTFTEITLQTWVRDSVRVTSSQVAHNLAGPPLLSPPLSCRCAARC